jgi:CheY-like chemotaxis protein
VILSTGYSGMITEETIQELGFRGLLVKPTTARALGEAVHRALHDPANSPPTPAGNC